MPRPRTTLAVTLTMLFTIGLAIAGGSWQANWISCPGQVESEWGYGGDDGTVHTVRVLLRYEPLDSSPKSIRISAEVSVDEPEVIDQIFIETGLDSDSDGHIGPGEWAVQSTGVVKDTRIATIAAVPPTELDLKWDGYRLKWAWEDGGVSYDQILAPGLTAD